MKICLNRNTLEQVPKSSYYNWSVYRLPFSINIDGIYYIYLCESYQEASNEYEYNLGEIIEDDFIPNIFFIPQIHGSLVLDTNMWQKERYT